MKRAQQRTVMNAVIEQRSRERAAVNQREVRTGLTNTVWRNRVLLHLSACVLLHSPRHLLHAVDSCCVQETRKLLIKQKMQEKEDENKREVI